MQELLLAVDAGLLGWSLTGIFTLVMLRRGQVEAPNERSMHVRPVPVGGGIGIVASVLVLWPLWSWPAPLGHAVLLAAFAALVVVSWVDDRASLSPGVRLLAQAVAIAACVWQLPTDVRLLPLPEVPIAAERVGLGIAWLWFVNLYNFMDGIDGLAGSETVAIGLGYVAVLSLAGATSDLLDPAVILTAASLGYLYWNWPPAKVFMGDVGSIPIGFLLGWLLIDLAFRGYWPAAIILPLYFLADATLTLLWRTLTGARPWQAHRQHFYQRAVLGGASVAAILQRVIIADAALIALAGLSLADPFTSLTAAGGLVLVLLLGLQVQARRRTSVERSSETAAEPVPPSARSML